MWAFQGICVGPQKSVRGIRESRLTCSTLYSLHLYLTDRLNKKDLAVIQNYLAKVAHKWIDIGVQLELDPENFKSNQRSSDRDSLRQMILTWLKGKESVPTWRALCTALRSAAVDESGIANKIEEKHLALVREEKPLPVTEECQDTISISKVGNALAIT